MLQDNFHSVSSIIITITYLYYRSQALSFSINKFPHWCDVIVTSSDGVEVKCHKCVLISRMEYFRTMLTGHWYEVSAVELFHFFFSHQILNNRQTYFIPIIPWNMDRL